MKHNINLRKIATMQNKSCEEVEQEAITRYIDSNRQVIEEYDTLFETTEDTIYNSDEFRRFLKKLSPGITKLSHFAQTLLTDRKLPELIWRYDQLKSFADREGYSEEYTEVLWNEFEAWRRNEQ